MIYKYFPELEKEFNNYWVNNRSLEINYLDLPASIDNYLTHNPKGIFKMLFDNSFSESSYVYKLRKVNMDSLGTPIRERVSYTNKTVYIYMISEDTNLNTNIFDFNSDDIVMFDFLLEYRQGLSPDISSIDYSQLSTGLSRLIFVYLDLMLNLSFEYLLDTVNSSNSNDLLSSLFELYVISEAHKLIRDWKMTVDSGYLVLRPTRDRFTINSDILDLERVCLENSPHENNISIYVNGENKEVEYFELLTIDTTSGPKQCVSWEDSSINIELEDLLLIDYYIEVS